MKYKQAITNGFINLSEANKPDFVIHFPIQATIVPLPRLSMNFQINKLLRKTLLILCFVTISLPIWAQGNISVLSWNLQNFGRTKSEATLLFIARTIRQYDVVAIQEVVSHTGGVKAVQRLINALHKINTEDKWDYVVSQQTTGSPYQSERYAFLWKKNKIKQYGNAFLDKYFGNEIEREPFLATFIAGADTFTLVSLHAIPKKRQPERELKYLKFFPSKYAQLHLIFLGDFNTPQDHTVFNPLKSMGYLPSLKGQKTTLKMKCVRGNCLASAYDNFFYNSYYFSPIYSGILPFYKSFPDMIAARKISDHVPVTLVFRLNK